jgi:hypothetical protein
MLYSQTRLKGWTAGAVASAVTKLLEWCVNQKLEAPYHCTFFNSK